MIRGIVFDLFDTLVDLHHDRLTPVELDGSRLSPSIPRLHAHLMDAIEAGGKAATSGAFRAPSLAEYAALQTDIDRALAEETLKQGFELPTRRRFEVLADRLGLPTPDLPLEMAAIHMGVVREAVVVPAHHEAVLASLAVGHRLGLCSNFSDGRTARAILNEAGFDAHLDFLVISEEVRHRKPRREIFDHVLASMDCAPREILHVGDSLSADVAGAARMGMQTVWLTRRIADPEAALAAYEGPAPDFALEDLLDLPVLAARLSG